MKWVWLQADRLAGLYVIAVLLWWRWQGQADSTLAIALVVAAVVLSALLSVYGLRFVRAFFTALPAPRPDSPQADYDDGPPGTGPDDQHTARPLPPAGHVAPMGERDADPDAPRGAPPSAALVGRRATMAATGVLLSLFSLGSCFANYVPFPHQQLLEPVITFGSAAGAVFAFLGAIFDRPRPGP